VASSGRGLHNASPPVPGRRTWAPCTGQGRNPCIRRTVDGSDTRRCITASKRMTQDTLGVRRQIRSDCWLCHEVIDGCSHPTADDGHAIVGELCGGLQAGVLKFIEKSW